MSCLGCALAAALAWACAHELSSEDRLERATEGRVLKDVLPAAELAKLACDGISPALAQARRESRPEGDRLASYTALYQDLRGRVAAFEEAMTRNPDLVYREDSQNLVAAKEACAQQLSEVRAEFERFVRELVNIPTMLEVKGGANVTVARVDFATLRQAIEALAPEDKDALLVRLSAAEKQLGGKR